MCLKPNAELLRFIGLKNGQNCSKPIPRLDKFALRKTTCLYPKWQMSNIQYVYKYIYIIIYVLLITLCLSPQVQVQERRAWQRFADKATARCVCVCVCAYVCVFAEASPQLLQATSFPHSCRNTSSHLDS